MADLDNLRDQITKVRTEKAEQKDNTLQMVGRSKNFPLTKLVLKNRKKLTGHEGKIYTFDWGPDSRKLVSAAQEGTLFVWDGLFSLKLNAHKLRSSWVMTSAFAPSGNFLAAGGLDNLCTIYKFEDSAAFEAGEGVVAELNGHEGYLSSAIFLDDNRVFTTSGDGIAALWSIPHREITTEFRAHTADVMCAAQSPSDENVFVTGSCDSYAMLWDIRTAGHPQLTFGGHESDINAISYFPDGNAFVCGSDDSTCRLFDIRACGVLNRYLDDRIVCGVTSIAVSKSGGSIIAAYDDGPVVVWDTIHAESISRVDGHSRRVSCVRTAPNGSAVCTASWDSTLMIWSAAP